ncbi:hypothetical protein C8J57DRAFT_1582488 [Mycena rebaudengoi]|nr:hypothetical protein C8J57DRAFT_1582488 [Mycena rebaudengoi]
MAAVDCPSIIAALISLELVPSVPVGWHALFWTASGTSVVLLALLPESTVFLKRLLFPLLSPPFPAVLIRPLPFFLPVVVSACFTSDSHGIISESQKTRILLRETRAMLKRHWMPYVYAVLLMSGGAFAGWLSQFLGWCIMIACVFFFCGRFGGACVVWAGWVELDELELCARSPPVLSSAWGVILIQRWRRPRSAQSSPGVTYQLGNTVSSASAQIEAANALAARLLAAVHAFASLHTTELTPETGGRASSPVRSPHSSAFASSSTPRVPGRVDGKPGMVPDYAKVQGILIGVIAAFVVFITDVGPEYVFSPAPFLANHGSHFEIHRAAFDEGGGADDTYIDDEGGTVADGRTTYAKLEQAIEDRSENANERGAGAAAAAATAPEAQKDRELSDQNLNRLGEFVERPMSAAASAQALDEYQELGNQSVKAASTEKAETAEKTIGAQRSVPINHAN